MSPLAPVCGRREGVWSKVASTAMTASYRVMELVLSEGCGGNTDRPDGVPQWRIGRFGVVAPCLAGPQPTLQGVAVLVGGDAPGRFTKAGAACRRRLRRWRCRTRC
jgi:hypothetical protein